MAASPTLHPWTFDVSSLIVLVSEEEERTYRLSQRSLLECLATIPIVGLQNYVRSYEFLLNVSAQTYFSPFGVKSAPLRNAQLANTIKHGKLLEDGNYTVFEVQVSPKPHWRRCDILLWVWTAFTWVFFASLIVALLRSPWTTWISITTCTAFTGWSVLLRLIEYCNVIRAPIIDGSITNPLGFDAVFILGRSNSAFVLQGSRQDVKEWTSKGLIYKDHPLGIPSSVWQAFTRLGSIVVLLLIFSAIPNGSTADQVAFVLLNAVAQLNVLIGPRLHGQRSLSRFSKVEDCKEPTRTHIYAKLINRFRDAEDKNQWVGAADLLPKTRTWDMWKARIVLADQKDPKRLYQELSSTLNLSYKIKE